MLPTEYCVTIKMNEDHFSILIESDHQGILQSKKKNHEETIMYSFIAFVVVESRSHVPLFATPATAGYQASLSFTVSWSLLKLMFTELVMPSNHLVLCHPFSSSLRSFPAPASFPMNWLFASCGQIIGASTSVLPMSIQG